MKKAILLFLLIILSLASQRVLASDNFSPEFIEAFRNCTPYSYTTPEMELFGMKINSEKQILGVKNNACYYIEHTGPINAKCELRCKFTKLQVDELTDAMLNNEDSGQPMSINLKSGAESFMTGGDLASRVWTKYLNNPNVCRSTCSN